MTWDAHPLAPEDTADDRFDPPAVRSVIGVTGGGPVQFGEAVQFEFAFADGGHATFRAACGDFRKIVSELRGFASITERASRASRERPVEVVNPYQATDARTDRVGPMVVVRLATVDGIPLLVALDHAVAEKLMLGIEQELARAK
jgi:hypothetical protein